MLHVDVGVRVDFPKGIKKLKDDIRQDLEVWHRESDGRAFIS